MPSPRQAASFAARFLIVTLVPLGGLLLAALVTGALDLHVPEMVRLVGGALLAFALLAGTSAALQRLTRCALRVRWLPLAYAAIVVIGIGGGKNVYDAIFSAHSLPEGAAALDVLLIQPASSVSAVEPVRELLEGPENRLRGNVRYSIASVSEAVGRRRLVLQVEGRDRRAALTALTASQRFVETAGVLPRRLLGWKGWRRDAAHAVVLNVDGIDPFANNPRDTGATPADWEAVLGRSNLPRVFVILGEASDERLELWQKWAARYGGRAMRARDLGRVPLVDAAFHLATVRDAKLDRALALRYRPRLFLDRGETYRTPLDVEGFLASDAVEVCQRVKWATDPCWSVTTKGLSKPRSYLRFEHKRLPPIRSAIYFHAVPYGDDELHLDYWWYFPFNPTPADHNVACEPGLTVGGATCFDHQSDWEGITVVLKKEGDAFAPSDVIYAQHEFGVAYSWDDLQGLWAKESEFDGERPLAFVARDSHASYPAACPHGCRQLVMSDVRIEGDHDGDRPWPMNDDGACGTACLKRFPQSKYGEPAGWNAGTAHWGKQDCVADRTICTLAPAPRAPRYQGRFWAPWLPLAGKKTNFGPIPVRYAKYE
jgi:hypothetical protein